VPPRKRWYRFQTALKNAEKPLVVVALSIGT
jgi:hypothetical protein